MSAKLITASYRWLALLLLITGMGIIAVGVKSAPAVSPPQYEPSSVNMAEFHRAETQSFMTTWLPLIFSGACTIFVGLGQFALNSKIKLAIQEALAECTTAREFTEHKNNCAILRDVGSKANTAETVLLRREIHVIHAKLNMMAVLALGENKEALARFFSLQSSADTQA